MRILLVGNLWKSYHEVTDECKIRDALRGLGHEVLDYNWDAGSTDELRGYRYIAQDKPQVDFCLVPKRVTAGQIRELRGITGAPVFYWCFDLMSLGWPSEEDLQKPHFLAAREADGYFGKMMGMGEKYRDIGIKFFYLPEDAVADVGREDESDRSQEAQHGRVRLSGEYPVLFAGTHYAGGADRPGLLREIQEKIAPVPLHVFSFNWKTWRESGFPNAHGGKWDGRLKYLISRTKIALAIDYSHDVHGYWASRIAKQMACGGFTLAKFTPGMEQAFGPDGDRLVYWDTVDDCVAKIRHYLSHEGERVEIAERGYQYAEQYMTFDYKVRQFLTILRYEYGIKSS